MTNGDLEIHHLTLSKKKLSIQINTTRLYKVQMNINEFQLIQMNILISKTMKQIPFLKNCTSRLFLRKFSLMVLNFFPNFQRSGTLKAVNTILQDHRNMRSV